MMYMYMYFAFCTFWDILTHKHTHADYFFLFRRLFFDLIEEECAADISFYNGILYLRLSVQAI